MVLVLTKKPKVEPGIQPEFETSTPADVAALMDEIGAEQEWAADVAKQIKALQAQLKPHAEKVKRLAGMVSTLADERGTNPDATFVENTADFVLEVGKAATERSVVNIELAMKRLGKKTFFEKATIGLGVLDQYLTPEEKQGVVETKRVERSVKLTRRST